MFLCILSIACLIITMPLLLFLALVCGDRHIEWVRQRKESNEDYFNKEDWQEEDF